MQEEDEMSDRRMFTHTLNYVTAEVLRVLRAQGIDDEDWAEDIARPIAEKLTEWQCPRCHRPVRDPDDGPEEPSSALSNDSVAICDRCADDETNEWLLGNAHTPYWDWPVRKMDVKRRAKKVARLARTDYIRRELKRNLPLAWKAGEGDGTPSDRSESRGNPKRRQAAKRRR